MTIKVIIVDDQPLVRGGLRMIIDAAEDIELVAETGNGHAAVDCARRTPADVIVMDVQMPAMDGLEATRRILALPAPPRILVLTTFDLDEYVLAALEAGASGFLLKDVLPEDLFRLRHLPRRQVHRAPHPSHDQPAGGLPAFLHRLVASTDTRI